MGKRDLDALLKGWQALSKDNKPLDEAGDKSWDDRASALVAKARAEASKRDAKGLEALLEAPALAPEAGELNGSVSAAAHAARSSGASGDRTMSSSNSDGSDSGARSQGGASPSVPPGGKRQSLKEIAARATKEGRASVPSIPGQGRPGATSTSTPLPGPVSTPAPSSVRRPVEAGSDDSGYVDLQQVRAAVTPQQVADAEKAKPGTESLFDDDKPSKAAAAKPVAAKALVPVPAKRGGGAVAGIAIAAIGIAAAFALVQMNRSKAPAEPVAAATAPAAATEAAPAATPEPAKTAESPKEAAKEPDPAPSAEPSDQALDPDKLPEAVAAPGGRRVAGRLPTAKEAPVDKAAPADKAPDKKAPVASGPAGDLKTEMQKAVGADGKPVSGEAVPEPAAGSSRNQTIPEQPSQGAVQSAIGAVLGGAKACVADADEATRATVTFASNGSVSNVSVSGWAASNGKSGCVVSSLKGAKVAPFSKSTYSFPVTIRP